MKAVTEFVVSVMRTEGPVGNGGVEYLRIRSHSCRDFFVVVVAETGTYRSTLFLCST